MIEQIKEALERADERCEYVEDYHSLDVVEEWLRYLIGEVEHWKEKEFIACSKHHEYHEEIEKLEDKVEELRKALEEIADMHALYFLSPQHALGKALSVARQAIERTKP